MRHCLLTKRLHAHEVWDCNDSNHVKINGRNCTLRNATRKTYWFTGIQVSHGIGNYENSVRHFMHVNKCDRVVFENI
jgi:hypothetical protein